MNTSPAPGLVTTAAARRVHRMLAGLFLVAGIVATAMGIVATATTIRLNSYIRETLPRDAAQEQCNTRTLDVLTLWLQWRQARDGALDARDTAIIAALDQMMAGEHVRAEHLRAWRDAITADKQIRVDIAHQFAIHPLPQC